MLIQMGSWRMSGVPAKHFALRHPTFHVCVPFSACKEEYEGVVLRV